MSDMFRAAEDAKLRGFGWFEGGGHVGGSLMWRDPVTGSLYTRQEALAMVERREKEHAALPAQQEAEQVQKPEGDG